MVNFKKYKNQDYKSLKAACVQNGALFNDPEFPADNSSLYFSKQPPFTAVWKRPKELSTNASLFVQGISSADVTQGRVGNCWFVAAAACVALEKDLWTKIIPEHKSQSLTPEKPEDYQGIFYFRFWRFGDWIEVVIDDKLPTVNNELIYVKSKARNEFWSALLEKAYAKLAGSYEALEGGNPADALVDFTGGVSESVDMIKGDYANNLERRKVLHQKMSKLMERSSLCSASIKIQSRDEMEQQLDTGLVKGHAYGICAVTKVSLGQSFFARYNAEKLYLVKLRNPWGEKEWNGAWSDGSKEWDQLSKSERDKLGLKLENDGEFWMSWDDFCKHFTTVTICVLVNTSVFTFRKTYNEGAMKGKWQGSNAGGCINYKETFLNNPQFRFDMTGNEKDVAFISLMQPDVREFKSQGKSNMVIGFFVMKVEANRSYRVHTVYTKAGDSSFINSREVFVRMELDPGRYLLIPSTFEPNQISEFLIRVYTDHGNSLRELVLDKPDIGCCSFLPFCRPPTMIMSCVVSAVNNLVKKGNVSLTVDPYCIIRCERTEVRTPTRSNNLNPEFDFGGLFYIKNPAKALLKIQVWDHNTLVPDTFLGEIQRTLEVNNKTYMYTEPLFGRKERDGTVHKADGTITFKMTVSQDMMLI